MKPLETVWSELVSRRLLPVAILLVAALAAIPFLLAKDPEPVAPVTSPVSAAPASTTAAGDPVVALVADGERTKRRRVLGARKNPFEPAAAPKAATTAQQLGSDPAPVQTTIQFPGGTVGSTPSTGGSSTPPVAAPPVSAPPASTPDAPKKRYELHSLTVRFGSTEGELNKLNLPRLKALPDTEAPVLVYLGLAEDAKTAIFMVDSNVVPQGDGSCEPSPANCETIHVRVGDTEFFDVKDEAGETTAQYQLDLLKITTSTTASAAKAKAARARVSKAGRRVLHAREASRGPLRWSYNVRSGSVRKLDRKAYKAAVAKTARIALAFSGGF